MGALKRLWNWIWRNPGKTARIIAALKRIMWPAPALLLCLALTTACASTADKQAYYNAQLEALKQQRPLLCLEAKEGEQIVLQGVKKLEIYVPPQHGGQIPQYRDEGIAALREGLGVAGTVAGVYVGGMWATELVKATGAVAGHNTNQTFTTQGANSPVITGPGTVSPNTTTNSYNTTDSYNPSTTTSTDSHDTSGQ